LLNKNILLRPILPGDTEKLFQWYNSSSIAKYNGIPFRFYSAQEINDEFLKTSRDKDKNFILGYVNNHTRLLIGIIEYRHTKPMLTGPEVLLRVGSIEDENILQYTFEAIHLLCEYILSDLGFDRLSLPLAGENVKLKDMLESIGFIQEARIREERFVAGKHIDTIYWGLLKEEFCK
jgi:RimJ/RimL family protein N-acetyltransferase